MKTALQVIEESIKQPWDGSADSTAEVIVKNLKAEGYVILNAKGLSNSIGSAIATAAPYYD